MENHSDIKHILQIRSVSIYRYMEMCHAPQARIQVNAPIGVIQPVKPHSLI